MRVYICIDVYVLCMYVSLGQSYTYTYTHIYYTCVCLYYSQLFHGNLVLVLFYLLFRDVSYVYISPENYG